MKSSQDIRKEFISFFKDREHQFVRSSSVVPIDDPTLLFTNAGMNQFKPIFLGQESPGYLRAVNSQKCIRVSGKHNDLEEVGVDNYHHTFFEMLGNWSFGDYYKEDAIKWAWELLTDVWKIDKDRLWVTIFQDDDEAGKIWNNVTDIAHDRVLKFGPKDNFWEMGETGPCGPCSEIHYYTGDLTKQSPVGVNMDENYREIWNLVFIQYNRDESGKLTDLPAKHVDTGAGFERLVAVLNGKASNYETDIFLPIIDEISKLTGCEYSESDGAAHRVIADHIRMLSFAIADGALPGNEGRGYVLRRVLRRAARFGRSLGMHEPFIYKLVSTLAKEMKDAFPEIKEKRLHIEKTIRTEESSFGDTLDRGLDIFSKITKDKSKGDLISGDEAFRLYDTYGFPLDLTQLLAREKEMLVDESGFQVQMELQKERARGAGNFAISLIEKEWNIVTTGKSSEFIGYAQLKSNSIIRKYRQDNNNIELILDKTPFYAEQGGQIGDTGTIQSDGLTIQVNDTRKEGDDIAHFGTIKSGTIDAKVNVEVEVKSDRRNNIQRNHTATHLLHQALKLTLGEHVHQAGSMVSHDRLRFDLTHHESLTSDQLISVENIVNENIRSNSKLDVSITSYDQAKQTGAVALFGEKYGNEVRMVTVPGFSCELCGGTHVNRTGDIGAFKIISETSLATGVRRIEAITGAAVIDLIHDHEKILHECGMILKTGFKDVPDKLNQLVTQKKHSEKQLEELIQGSQKEIVRDLISQAESFNGIQTIVRIIENAGDLKMMGDEFRSVFKTNGVALIFTVLNQKPMIMCAVTDNLTSRIQAGNIVKELGKFLGGGGGGKPHLATSGGKDLSKLDDAVQAGKNLIQSIISKN